MTTHEHNLTIVSTDDYHPTIGQDVCICLSNCTGWRIVRWREDHAEVCDYWFSLDEITEQLP